MDNTNNFILTKDDNSRQVLKKLGFQELSKNGEFYTFINNHKISHFDKSKLKIVYTNKMYF